MRWLLIIAIFIFSSCQIERKIYSPLPLNNPSVERKNDFSVNASVSSPKGFDFQGGYAVTDHLALLAGAYTHQNKDRETSVEFFSNQYDSSNLNYHHHGFTLGPGVYFPVF